MSRRNWVILGCLIGCCWLPINLQAQSFVFAQMTGTPLNTTGWNLQGNAYVGNTGSNTGNGELILTDPIQNRSGSVFFNTPINLAQCSKWIAEFEFRIQDGTAADGLAFCYLDVPPAGFVAGGGLGIPGSANGLKVCIDTWRNCGTDAVPKLQIRWGNGYNECNGQPTLTNNSGLLNFIRSGDYHLCKIEYDAGNISVSINGVQRLTAFQTFNFQGYFGFTASTGAFTDRHSIRNVRIFTEMPPSVAGTDTSVCHTGTLQLGTTPNAAYQYRWSPAAGLSATNISNPVVTVQNNTNVTIRQKYYVRTEYANLPGCGSTDSVEITVFPKPRAEFDLLTDGCSATPVIFTDRATAGDRIISRYRWDFGDGNSSTQASPSHRFGPGSFSVKQWIETADGCVDSLIKPVNLTLTPTADFAVGPVRCVGTPITLTDLSAPAPGSGSLVRWTWNYGDGRSDTLSSIANTTVQYPAAGSYTVTLSVETETGCRHTMSRMVEVGAFPRADFSLPAVCLNDAFAAFTNRSTLSPGDLATVQWRWTFGDPNATPANPDNSTLASPQHRYSAVGNYSVKLVAVAPGNCADSLTQTLTVNGDQPKAQFVIENAGALCSNLPVQIRQRSTVNFGAITKTEVYWQWPDTSVVTVDEDPQFDESYSHTYPAFSSPATRTVQVRLVAYSGGVCVNDLVQTITLQAKPQPVVSRLASICEEALPRLLTEGRDAAGLPGTGAFSGPGVLPGNIFDPGRVEPGLHTLQYRYQTTAGCVDSVSTDIAVLRRPTADFSVQNPSCVGQELVLTDASVAHVGKIVDWQWSLSDAFTQSGPQANLRHTFLATGPVSATLQVTTDSGCISLPVRRDWQVRAVPVADFVLPSACLPAGKAEFLNKTTIADGTDSRLSYQWSFGYPGGNSTLANPTAFFPGAGPFPVQLIATSVFGCSDTVLKQMTDIYPQPRAGISSSPPLGVCLGDLTAFTSVNNPLGQLITNHFWTFGDGQTADVEAPTHRYREAGSFNVTYYYRTDAGCFSDTVQTTALVYPYPVVSAGPDLIMLEGGQITLQGSATGSSSYVYRWSPPTWLSDASVLRPVARPPADVRYRLTVTGEGGCSAEDEVFVKVLLQPVVPNAFSPNGDGINDTWNIRYLDSYPGATVEVFDRYGRRVLQSTGYSQPWDGRLNGQPLPIGTYYYIINPKNGRPPMTGSVTIVR